MADPKELFEVRGWFPSAPPDSFQLHSIQVRVNDSIFERHSPEYTASFAVSTSAQPECSDEASQEVQEQGDPGGELIVPTGHSLVISPKEVFLS